jgi:hypothetical protein
MRVSPELVDNYKIFANTFGGSAGHFKISFRENFEKV